MALVLALAWLWHWLWRADDALHAISIDYATLERVSQQDNSIKESEQGMAEWRESVQKDERQL